MQHWQAIAERWNTSFKSQSNLIWIKTWINVCVFCPKGNGLLILSNANTHQYDERKHGVCISSNLYCVLKTRKKNKKEWQTTVKRETAGGGRFNRAGADSGFQSAVWAVVWEVIVQSGYLLFEWTCFCIIMTLCLYGVNRAGGAFRFSKCSLSRRVRSRIASLQSLS